MDRYNTTPLSPKAALKHLTSEFAGILDRAGRHAAGAKFQERPLRHRLENAEEVFDGLVGVAASLGQPLRFAALSPELDTAVAVVDARSGQTLRQISQGELFRSRRLSQRGRRRNRLRQEGLGVMGGISSPGIGSGLNTASIALVAAERAGRRTTVGPRPRRALSSLLTGL